MSRVVHVVNTYDVRELEEHSRLPAREREIAILTFPGDTHQDETADDPRLFPDARFSVREGMFAPRAYHPADAMPDIPGVEFPQPTYAQVFPDPQWAGPSSHQNRTST